MIADKKVKSLFELAFVAVYHHVVGQLESQLYLKTVNEGVDNCPPKKKIKVDSRVETKKLNSAAAIKAQLDEYLVSWYSHLRPQLIQRFIHNYCINHGGLITTDSHTKLHLSFFDSLLDQNVTIFDLTAVRKDYLFRLEDPTQLLQVITKRSPLLQTLNLTFFSHVEAPAVDKGFCQLLGKLTHLTCLTLSFKSTSLCLDFFSSLGESCPQLSSLRLGKIPFGTDQVLALVLGSKRALLPPAFPKDVEKLADVQLSPESVSPICNSLKKLCYDCDDIKPCFKPPTIFFLRHIKNLEVWKLCMCKRQEETQIILKWLQKKKARKSLRLLQKNKKTTSSSIQWTYDSPFSGQLNLVSLYGGVSIKSRKVMETVMSAFPNLEEINFVSHPHELMVAKDILSVQELKSLVFNSTNGVDNFWSKLKRVGLVEISSDYRLVVLSAIGHQLQSLCLMHTLSIDVIAELGPYDQLEELTITDYCTLLPPPLSEADFPPADTFLPRLKKLTIGCCIDLWSPLFERHRPLLTKLKLACPHIGIPPRSKFNWTDVPNLWPSLRRLNFSKVNGLTEETLREMVSQLKQLERLCIPNVLEGFPEGRLEAIQDEFQNEKDPADSVQIRLDFKLIFMDDDHY